MGSLVNFINNFKRDITSLEEPDECKQFFFKSIMHLMVSLEIASSSILDEKINFSKLKSSIPSSLGTEDIMREVLNEGVKKSFFIESKSLKKNKQTSYKISKKYSLMITNWYLDKKQNLTNPLN